MTTGTHKYQDIFLPVIMMWCGVLACFPMYQYQVDPDGTAYLTISARYAAGDWQHAVNGLWSPLACWLTAILIKSGISAIPASVAVNSGGATLFMLSNYGLCKRFGISRKPMVAINYVMAAFLVFAVYWQSFNDLWQCGLLTTLLLALSSGSFPDRPRLWIATGALAALAYFAKAYSLPYFLLLFPVAAYLQIAGKRAQMSRMLVVTLVVFGLVAAPWIVALHNKYHIWTTSTAGPLNMSWYLVGHPEWKEGITTLVPPVYRDSPWYWEDPYFANGHLSHFYDSWHLFGMKILRTGYTCLQALLCMLQISVFLPLIYFAVLVRMFKPVSRKKIATELQILYISFLLLPLGYVTVHVESRYLWPMLPVAFIAGWHILQNTPFRTASMRNYSVALFFSSFLAYPALKMVETAHTGAPEYRFAQQMKQAGYEGVAFISNVHQRSMSKVAYFSGGHLYSLTQQRALPDNRDRDKNTQALVKDARARGVHYYIYAPSNEAWLESPDFDKLYYKNLEDTTNIVKYKLLLQDQQTGLALYELP